MTQTKTSNQLVAGVLVDQLGQLKANIAELEAKERELKDRIIALGVKEVEGEWFRATVHKGRRTIVDWKELRKAFHPAPFQRMIAKYSVEVKATVVRVVSR